MKTQVVLVPCRYQQGVVAHDGQDVSQAFDVEDLDLCEDLAVDFASALHGGDVVSGRAVW